MRLLSVIDTMGTTYTRRDRPGGRFDLEPPKGHPMPPHDVSGAIGDSGEAGRRRTVLAQETKAVHEMSHEEAEAALPKLREEAHEADVRLQAAMQRVADTIEVPT